MSSTKPRAAYSRASPLRRRRSRSPARLSIEAAPPPLVCFPGGGTLFWWQMGAATKLLELYDCSDIVMPGYSAGALAAVLSRCAVDPELAHRCAFKLADDAGVFSNPLGLACTWGRLVYAWLDELLPENAHQVCSGVAAVVLTRLTPWPRVATAQHFDSRDDLIASLMASTHIPFFMDGRFSRSLADGRCAASSTKGAAAISAVDGGFLEFFGVATAEQLLTHGARVGLRREQPPPPAILLDALRDASFTAAMRAHGWSMLNPVGTEHFMEYGAAYVEEQAALGTSGCLAPLDARLRASRATLSESSKRTRQRLDRMRPASTSMALQLAHGALLLAGIAMIGIELFGLASFSPSLLRSVS